MPSPIAHTALILFAVPALRKRGADQWPRSQRRALWLAVLVALVAPDIDFAFRLIPDLGPGLFAHGGLVHSFATCVVFAVLFGVLVKALLRVPLSFASLMTIGGLCYGSHIVMDACTRGSGVMMLWPLSAERFALKYPLFYGFNHSQLGAWNLHLITLTTELLFVALVWLLSKRLFQRSRIPTRKNFHLADSKVGPAITPNE